MDLGSVGWGRGLWGLFGRRWGGIWGPRGGFGVSGAEQEGGGVDLGAVGWDLGQLGSVGLELGVGGLGRRLWGGLGGYWGSVGWI